jgi:predicted PurR-regulated permease PerM
MAVTHSSPPARGREDWPRKAVGWAAIAALLAVAVYVLAPVGQVLLIGFAGVILGIFWDGLARLLAAHSPLGRTWSLVAVLLSIVAAVAGGIALLAPVVVSEATTAIHAVPAAFDGLRSDLAAHAWGRTLLDELPTRSDVASSAHSWVSGAARVVQGAVGVIGGGVVIVVVGLFVAIDPSVYANAMIRLAPPARRRRVGEVLSTLREKLWWWVVGRMVNMVVIGALTSAGLWALGVPAPFALGGLAGVLTFVPNVGPVLSFIPAALLGWTVSPTTVIWVALLFVAAQTLESYVITPLVQRRAAAVPPAVLLIAQLVFGVPFGALGLLLATPLVAIAIVATRMLYVEDRLERSH